ncbi:hypothetical protein AGLY_004351 [Aphis glycines]|uniref:Uncharacterized protein n=1 Tax=Aphis glycines TaxID=307491 RepID=A0A6G0TXX0_APHGL|nr:hypothetical protein AGLY_004351 [Aphis glycines]
MLMHLNQKLEVSELLSKKDNSYLKKNKVIRRSRHHLRFKRLPGSPGMLRVDKFEIRGLRWLKRFEWNRLYRVLATCCTVGIERSLWIKKIKNQKSLVVIFFYKRFMFKFLRNMSKSQEFAIFVATVKKLNTNYRENSSVIIGKKVMSLFFINIDNMFLAKSNIWKFDTNSNIDKNLLKS